MWHTSARKRTRSRNSGRGWSMVPKRFVASITIRIVQSEPPCFSPSSANKISRHSREGAAYRDGAIPRWYHHNNRLMPLRHLQRRLPEKHPR